MRIDIHAHFVPDRLPDMALRTGDARWPQLETHGTRGRILLGGAAFREVGDDYWSVSRRIESLDRLGIDVQVVSPLPVLLPTWGPVAPAAEWCRALNERLAEEVALGDGRLLGLGALPMQDADAAADELAHVRALGLVGVELGTAVDEQRSLGHPTVDVIFSHLAAEDVPVLVHPVRRGFLGELPAMVDVAVGFPADTASALVGRLFRTDAAMPRCCAVHGGGTLPWNWPRVRALAAQDPGPLPPWLHVDTASVSAGQLDYLIGELGSQRILFGTDAPAASFVAVEHQSAIIGSNPAGPDLFAGNARHFLQLPLLG